MTLQEFFSDKSFGGSWADDEIDMASISVPIEKHKHSVYSKDPFGSSNSSGGFGGHSYNRLSGLHDNGPPYIVKLLNLPVTSNDAFIEDLFKSRYTAFVKFKIVVDPSSNILETRVIKKVAFVELGSFQEMNKVLKWQDLYYKATRRVVVELADFHDFQHCISFNQEHEREIQEIQDDFVKQKQSQHFGHGGFEHGPSRNININSPTRKYQPLNSHATALLQPSLSDRKSSIPHEDAVAPPAAAPTKNKPNPFGAAKPVDVLSKQHEIDKKLITINHTTIKTLGPMADNVDLDQQGTTDKHSSEESHVPRERRASQKSSRRPSVNILKRPPTSTNENATSPESHQEPKETERSQLMKAPIPESIYAPSDNNKSLAELLSKNKNPSPPPKGRGTPKSIKNSPKPNANKPVILKKKSQVPTVDLTVKESEFISNSENSENSTADKDVDNKPKDKEINDNLKEMNDSLSQDGKPENIHDSNTNGSIKYKEAVPELKFSHEVDSKINEAQSVSTKEENKKTIEAHVPPSQEAERANDRPNFKKHFAELSKRQNAQREKMQNSQKTRSNSHSQTVNNKRSNGINYRRQNPKESSLPTEVSKSIPPSSQDSNDTKNIGANSNSNGGVSKDDRVSGPKISGRNKSRPSGRSKSTDLPKKDVKKIEDVKSRKSQANLKSNYSSRNGKKAKEISNADQVETLNGTKDIKELKDVKDLKDVKGITSEASVNALNDAVTNDKSSKDPGLVGKEVITDPGNELTSSSTGGKQSIENAVNTKEADSIKSDMLDKASTTSNRGRGRGGRSRGRGGFRGSVRGSRGRGRGNFNLHYVRSKDDKNVES